VPFLGRIPLDARIRIGGDNGKPIVIDHGDSPAGQAILQVALAVASRASVIILGNSDVIPLNVIG